MLFYFGNVLLSVISCRFVYKILFSVLRTKLMRGTAQPDGQPLVDQNSGPIFRRLWTKVHRIKFTCAVVSVVCNAVFRLTISFCFLEIFAINLWNRRNFDVFGRRRNFVGKEQPKFLTEFYKTGSPSNMRQSLMTIGQATSKIRRWKKKEDLNYSTTAVKQLVGGHNYSDTIGNNRVMWHARGRIQQIYHPFSHAYHE